MLKEMLLKKLNTQSQTVNNAIITLGDTDDSGKGRHFKSRFIQPGLAGYPGQYGNALIRKENLDKFIHTMRNKPVIINHKNNITEKDKVGDVFNVWFNPDDGWYWCDGIITDKTAQNLIENKKWSVSCSYDFTKYDDEGGEENGIPYDIEFLDGEFSHLAIVNNPRYERANIVFNSKAEKDNEMEDYKLDNAKDRDGKDGEWITVKGTHVFIPEGANQEEVVKDFLEKKQKGEGKEKSEPEWLQREKQKLDRQTTQMYEDRYGYEEGEDGELHPKKSEGGSEEPSDDYKREADIALTMMGRDYEKRGNKETVKRSNELKDKLKKGEELSDKDKSDIKIALDTYKPKDESKGYSLSDKYKNHVQFEGDKESSGYPRKIHKDLESAKKFYEYKKEGQNGAEEANLKEKGKRGIPLRDHPVIVKNPLGDGYIVATSGLAQKHKLTEVYPIDRSKADNSKEQDMAILEMLKEFISKVENDKGDNMINNEKEDKRKLIDEVGGILKGKVDDEIIRTIIKKMEEASYNESEAGSADNKKVKNEAEDDEKKDEKKDDKKVANEDEKEEDKKKVDELKEDEKKDVENKCNNSKEDFIEKMNKIYNSSVATPKTESYTSRAERLKMGEDYFKV